MKNKNNFNKSSAHGHKPHVPVLIKEWRRAIAILLWFKNWKDDTVTFKDHQSSATYKIVLQLVVDMYAIFVC